MLVCVFERVQPWQATDANDLLGFMTKIKKLLETVCHNCGKILVDEVSYPNRDGEACVVMC